MGHPQIAAIARVANGSTTRPARNIGGEVSLLTRGTHDIRYDEVHDEILLTAPRLLSSAAVFLQIEGTENENIKIDGGDVSKAATTLARKAVELSRSAQPYEQGLSIYALADALALAGDVEAATDAYAQAVSLLEGAARWRNASTACRAWGRLLRDHGMEQQALDVLDRAAELGMRAAPNAAARAER